jgi:hypothetical protein
MVRSWKFFPHVSKMSILTGANSVIIKKPIILNIMHNIFNLRGTEVVIYICTIYTRLDTCLVSISRFSLRDKVTLRLLKLYFNIADVAEWSRALDIRLSDWCCSVSMVWVQIPSRGQLKDQILTLFGLIFRRIIYIGLLKRADGLNHDLNIK